MVTFNEREVKNTRKQHWCYGCDFTFPAGSVSLNYHGVGDDGPWSIYFCPDCLELKAKVGEEKFRKWYNEACQDEQLDMGLREYKDHPRYETAEQYNERRKKERLEKSKIAGNINPYETIIEAGDLSLLAPILKRLSDYDKGMDQNEKDGN